MAGQHTERTDINYCGHFDHVIVCTLRALFRLQYQMRKLREQRKNMRTDHPSIPKFALHVYNPLLINIFALL